MHLSKLATIFKNTEIYVSHFTHEATEAGGRLSSLPKVTQLIQDGVGLGYDSETIKGR